MVDIFQREVVKGPIDFLSTMSPSKRFHHPTAQDNKHRWKTGVTIAGNGPGVVKIRKAFTFLGTGAEQTSQAAMHKKMLLESIVTITHCQTGMVSAVRTGSATMAEGRTEKQSQFCKCPCSYMNHFLTFTSNKAIR